MHNWEAVKHALCTTAVCAVAGFALGNWWVPIWIRRRTGIQISRRDAWARFWRDRGWRR